MSWRSIPCPKAEWTYFVTYCRPGGDVARVGPMKEEQAKGMVAECARKGLDATLEEWGPVRAWRKDHVA